MAKKHDLSDKKVSVCHAPLPLPLPYAKVALQLQAKILAPGIFWANLMHLVLRILKFRFLKEATLENFAVLLFRP
jgi:hypothetical protein